MRGDRLEGAGTRSWSFASTLKIIVFASSDLPGGGGGCASYTPYIQVVPPPAFSDGTLYSNEASHLGSPKFCCPAWTAFGLSQGTCRRKPPIVLVWSRPSRYSRMLISGTDGSRLSGYT